MATPKLQVGRALAVIPSDNCNIPLPAITISGISTGLGVFSLTDTNTDFIVAGVQEGDVVYNMTDSTAATVTHVDSAHVLSLNATIFNLFGATKTYVIYSGTPKESCVLYVGGAGNIKLTTDAGDIVTFVALPVGSFIPVQTSKVFSTGTTATNLIALW